MIQDLMNLGLKRRQEYEALATRTAGLSTVLARDGRSLALYNKDSAVHHYHTGLGAPALGRRVSAPARKLPRTVQQRPSQSPAGFRGSKVGPGSSQPDS
jgi:hypothetical protein